MANRKRETASISDVARAAKVCPATVSRVFNRTEAVRSDTRERVLKAAAKLKFRLESNRPGPKPYTAPPRPLLRFIRFLDPRAEAGGPNEDFLRLKAGIETAAETAGYRMSFHAINQHDDLSFHPDEPEAQGYVLMGPRPTGKTSRLLQKKPCCWAMAGTWSPDFGDQIMPDHYEVGRMAARYLLAQGCTQIAMLEAWPEDRFHRFRERGFALEMESASFKNWQILRGHDPDHEPGITSNPMMAERLVEHLVACDPRPDGCFIDGDRTLFMMYPRLKKLGFLPQRDVHLISCNPGTIYREQLPFEYPSIDVQYGLIGELCVAQLLWRIAHPQRHPQIRSLVLPSFPGTQGCKAVP